MYIKKCFADLVVKYGSIFGKDKTMTDNFKMCLELTEELEKHKKRINQYKQQLKRKEQECETLASQLDFEVQKKECLEQECEELKEAQKNSRCAWKSLEGTFCPEAQQQLDQLKAENEILKEKFEIAIKNNMDKTLLRLEKGDIQEELQEIREQFGIETLYCHVDNTRVHRCLDVLRLKDTLTEIKEIAEPYQKDIDKICGNCRRYDGCHACCMDTLNNYEYRTGTTKACDKFIELKDFDINKLANQILQKISECEGNDE